MEIIWLIVVGLIIGAIAKLAMPGKDPGGLILTCLLGIAGSVVAGYLGRVMGMYGPGEPAGFIAAIFGAMILLFVYRAVRGRRV